MEAMASEKPVIGTDVRGNRGLIQHGEPGLLVLVEDNEATAEAITRHITDKELYVVVGKEAREYVEQYSLGHVLKEMADIYNEKLSR